MRLAIGSDHRGLALKNRIAMLLQQSGHTYEDFGVYTDERSDYPQIAQKVGQAVASGQLECGILVCGTGIGMCMVANKVKGIRAAMAFNTFTAQRAREHNDANILCLGAENDQSQLPEIINIFLTTKFEGGRHTERIQMIKDMEG